MKNSFVHIILILYTITLCSISNTSLVIQHEYCRIEIVRDKPVSSSFLSNDLIPKITWKSRENPNDSILENGAIIEGDHVTIKANFEPVNNSIYKSKMVFHGRSPLNATCSLKYIHNVHPQFQDELDWLIVENITKGLIVEIKVNFTNVNCDIYVWWNDELQDDELVISSSLLGNQLATSSKPERGSFIPNRSGDLSIGCFNYSNSTGNWSVMLNQHSFDYETEGSDIEVDTYYMETNVECGLIVTGYARNGVEVNYNYTNLTITNYFAPVLENVTFERHSDSNITISWDVHDLNSDDGHFFEIFISVDDGTSFQFLVKDLVETCWIWNSTGFLSTDYIFKIRAYDNDFKINPNATSIEDCWPGLCGEITTHSFEHNHIPFPTTTSQTSTFATSYTNLSLTSSLNEQIFVIIYWSVVSTSLSIIVVFSYLIARAKHQETGFWEKH